jgi:hypothetical protein
MFLLAGILSSKRTVNRFTSISLLLVLAVSSVRQFAVARGDGGLVDLMHSSYVLIPMYSILVIALVVEMVREPGRVFPRKALRTQDINNHSA